jgi:hypothetical protein
MKRHICAGAGALVLALAGAGTATAGGLPILGGQQQGVQSASLGDQSVGEQSNTADVTQTQGSFNLNVSPAIAILGDASTENAQGNGNTAVAGVSQSNEASQSQAVDQTQRLVGGSSGCCASGGQEPSQSAEGGDQSVGEQRNDADVMQEQGNGNINISPAIAIGGDAATHNEQGNGNTAVALVDQANSADQSQDVAQEQSVTSGGGGCCGAQSQSAEQTASGGDQSVGKQKNEADVTQEQGNGNVNASPAIAIGGGKQHDSCGPCSKGKDGDGGSSASTWNAQGNGNKAVALVGQSNTAGQSQDVAQKQVVTSEGGCCAKPHTSQKPTCKTPKQPEHLCGGTSGQAAEQSVWGGDQSVGKQKNEADVTQKQGNGNVNISPAIAVGGKEHDSCSPCWKDKSGDGGSSASTWNAQGNGNNAVAGVWQGNTATQSQSVWQGQRLIDACKEVMRW